jgi:hypothetical protein
MSDLNPFAFLFGVFVVLLVARAVVVIPESKRGAMVRLGKYFKTLKPGLTLRVPFIDLVTHVDLDASIPGWQGMSERELDAAVESLVTYGTAVPMKAADVRPAPAPRSSSMTREAQALTEWLLKRAGEQTGADLSKDPMAGKRIAERAASAIEELHSSESCEINLPFLTADASGPKHFLITLNRSQLDELSGSSRR